MKSTPSPKDIKVLSSYLDQQLSEDQKNKIELRLEKDEGLKIALENLRLTRNALRAAPQAKAPRNFVLSQEMLKGRNSTWAFYSSMRFVSSIASILFVIVFMGDFFNTNVFSTKQSLESASVMANEVLRDDAPAMEMESFEAMEVAPLALDEATPEEIPTAFAVAEPAEDILQEEIVTEEMVGAGAGTGEILMTPTTVSQDKVSDNSIENDGSDLNAFEESSEVEGTDLGQIELDSQKVDENFIDSVDMILLLKWILASLALITGTLSLIFRRR